MPEQCEIKVRGHLGQYWSEWFSGLQVTSLEDDVCLLSGELPDQAALHGLLERIWDLNLTLVSVTSRSGSAQAPSIGSAGNNTKDPTAGSEGMFDSLGARPTELDSQQDKTRRLSDG